jgi:geranylgeranyl diphosphate synthase type II
MEFEQELRNRREMIEDALDKMLPDARTRPDVIHRAMRYAVVDGGKRLRPILVLEGARLAGGDMKKALPLACAIEFIHSYSLVHDDLPAMDDDDLRRGKPTCHKVFGEAMAILAGDALLTRAFELPVYMAADPEILPANIMRAWSELAHAAGSQGMIAGQVVDLESENKKVDAETLQFMHQNKTGALFKAALKSGAMLFGASEEQLLALDRFAQHFGLAFQITDDILDVEGDENIVGKPVGSDARSDKATYVSIYGLSESRDMAKTSIKLAINSLEGFGDESWFLREIAQSVLDRRS